MAKATKTTLHAASNMHKNYDHPQNIFKKLKQH